jgi:hypothetical protein
MQPAPVAVRVALNKYVAYTRKNEMRTSDALDADIGRVNLKALIDLMLVRALLLDGFTLKQVPAHNI